MKKNTLFAALLLALACTTSCQDKEERCIDESKIDPNKVCTMEYDPVCGCDGKTYGNSCEAERAGVTSHVAGACAEDAKQSTSDIQN